MGKSQNVTRNPIVRLCASWRLSFFLYLNKILFVRRLGPWPRLHESPCAALAVLGGTERRQGLLFADFLRITMPKTLSDLELKRIRTKLREALGRDLTRNECRYLGLADVAMPPEQEPPNVEADTNRGDDPGKVRN